MFHTDLQLIERLCVPAKLQERHRAAEPGVATLNGPLVMWQGRFKSTNSTQGLCQPKRRLVRRRFLTGGESEVWNRLFLTRIALEHRANHEVRHSHLWVETDRLAEIPQSRVRCGVPLPAEGVPACPAASTGPRPSASARSSAGGPKSSHSQVVPPEHRQATLHPPASIVVDR